MSGRYKSQLALETRDRLLGISEERTLLGAAKSRPPCEVRWDRGEFTASPVSEDEIQEIPGFRRKKKHFVRSKSPSKFALYRRVTRLTSNTSIREITVLTERRLPTIAECKVTMIARDELGLQPKDVFAVLELLPDAKLVLVELAFDFGYGSGVDGTYVRKHALFGKSRRNHVGSLRCYDSWGSRRGAKFVRSYFK